MKLLPFFLMTALLLMLNSCNEAEKQAEEEVEIRDFPEMVADGKLHALFDNSTYSYYIYRGRPMGFEFELLNAFAQDHELELEVEIVSDLEEVFSSLNDKKGDIIAYNLTITNKRKELIAFSNAYLKTRQVLVQRKPENWRKLTWEALEKTLVRDVIDLDGKEVVVRSNSSFVSRLQNLSEEIGGEIIIVEADHEEDVETLIRKVAKGELTYTVADENIAKILSGSLPDIDVQTPISFSQQLAFGLRHDSPKFLDTLNTWLSSRSQYLAILSSKYFRSKSRYRSLVNSPYFSAASGIISPYDEQIRLQAARLNWDWRFLAALIYQESSFDANAVSWAGAKGLMQLIPSTAVRFGMDTSSLEVSIAENLKAGTNYLLYLQKYWQERIPDSTQRIKFVLASYNAGLGHILDARNLCEKYGGKPSIWDKEVEEFLLKKSVRKYYTDPVVKQGYSRGFETVHYVHSVYSHYHHYLNKVAEKKDVTRNSD